MTDPANETPTPKPVNKDESVKETIISVIISFAMAFVFRSYVVEPFRIPTGSMAPTLLGAHMRFHSPVGGYDWTVNPRDENSSGAPLRLQAASAIDADPLFVQDPLTGAPLERRNVRLRAGDRILVLKYLYLLREPRRYEVVVFKNPEDPAVNLIKRLVGLPGEDVLVVDGDIFARTAGSADPYRITRKPERAQREVWDPIADSAFAPLAGTVEGWRGPWAGEGWNTDGRIYRQDTADSSLTWDDTVRAINDFTPYNATLSSGHPARAVLFPVSDLRIRASVNPDAPSLTATLSIATRGHTFEATISGTSAELRGTPEGADAPTMTAEITGSFLPAGRYSDLEFWHVDQSLQLWVNGEKILETAYEWTPEERYTRGAAAGSVRLEPADPRTVAPPVVGMRFTGSPVSLAGVALDRDLYYRAVRQAGRYFRATHPTYPVSLTSEQYFMLGDNSAASHDGRSWSRVNPWIGESFGYEPGVVHHDLILGKAFMVYWPAPYDAQIPPGIKLPIPDVGRVRFIR